MRVRIITLGVCLLASTAWAQVEIVPQPWVSGGGIARGVIAGTDGSVTVPSRTYISDTNLGSYRIGADNEGFTADGVLRLDYNTTRLNLSSPYALAWADDLFLYRDAANILGLRNGTAGQMLRVYNTDNGSNDEFAIFGWASSVLAIGSDLSGTGTARGVAFYTGGTNRWNMGATTGHLTAAADNTYDIGAAGATRPRDGFFAGRIAQNTREAITVDAATTFAVTSGYVTLACTGAETINTITGGVTGLVLTIEHTDTDCTIADDDDATASNAIDLTGTATNDVGAVNKTIQLLYNATYWLQVAESDN